MPFLHNKLYVITDKLFPLIIILFFDCPWKEKLRSNVRLLWLFWRMADSYSSLWFNYPLVVLHSLFRFVIGCGFYLSTVLLLSDILSLHCLLRFRTSFTRAYLNSCLLFFSSALTHNPTLTLNPTQTPYFAFVFHDWITSKRFELSGWNLVWWFVMTIRSAYWSRIKIRPP